MLSIRDADIAWEQGRGMASELTPAQLEAIGAGLTGRFLTKHLKSLGEGIVLSVEQLEVLGRAIGLAIREVL